MIYGDPMNERFSKCPINGSRVQFTANSSLWLSLGSLIFGLLRTALFPMKASAVTNGRATLYHPGEFKKLQQMFSFPSDFVMWGRCQARWMTQGSHVVRQGATLRQ